MPENQSIEFKETWKDEYLKWICGFANANGGSLFIGKNDKGEIVPIENAKKLLEDIQDNLFKKAKKALNDSITSVKTYEELIEKADERLYFRSSTARNR